jgi:hypothetical protein
MKESALYPSDMDLRDLNPEDIGRVARGMDVIIVHSGCDKACAALVPVEWLDRLRRRDE